MKLKPTIIICFLLIGLVPLYISIGIAYYFGAEALKKNVVATLTDVKISKKAMLEDYISDEFVDTNLLTNFILTIPYYKNHYNDAITDGITDQSVKKFSFEINKVIKTILANQKHHHNFFLIDNGGNIIYSHPKDQIVGTNLLLGTYKDTNLGKAFQRGIKKTEVVDFDFYSDQDTPYLFIVQPIIDYNQKNKQYGYFATCISAEEINQIMHAPTGMGDSVESFLIGPDHMLRSDLKLDKKMTVAFSLSYEKNLDTETITEVLNGQTGLLFSDDYRGIKVITSYIPVTLKNLKWGLIVKIDQSEAFQSVNNLAFTMIILSIIVMVIVVIISYYLADSIVKPIHNTVEAIKSIAAGNFDIVINRSPKKNEIADLQNASIKLREDLNKHIAEIKDKSTMLYDQNLDLRRKEKVIQAINKIFQETIAYESINQVANLCLKLAEELTESYVGFIGVINSLGTMDNIAMSNPGWDQCKIPDSDKAILLTNMEIKGLWGEVIHQKKSIILNDILETSDKIKLPEGHPPLTSFLGVPLWYGNRVIGIIALANKKSGYDRNDQEAIEMLSVAYAQALNRIKMDIEIKVRKEHLEEINIELKKANKQKNKFLSSLSHELRTPLNAILGFTELLSTQYYGVLNGKQMDYVQLVNRSAYHLLTLIEDLLDIARIDAGKIMLYPEVVSINTVINDVVELMIAQFTEKNIQFNINLEYAIKNVFVDKKRIKQVLFNILSNSLKYTPENGRVEVKTEKLNNDKMMIIISDTGLGISDEDKAKLFEEFYQVNDKRDIVLQGLGIGLALSRRLVELMGGEINIESEIDIGTKIFITLPINTNKVGEAIIDKPKEPVIKAPRQKRIIVAEDNDINLHLILDLLKIHEHNVAIALNGQEVLDILAAFNPDLILMDIRMPVMDGLETTRKIREMENFKNLPIISLTASVDEQSKKEQLKAGCNDILSKPINSAGLFAILAKYLS